MTTYPDNTDWVGKGWHEQPKQTTMTVHDEHGQVVVLYIDINDRQHMLTLWSDGLPTFTPNVIGYLGCEPPLHTSTLDPRLQRLADAWLEYLDAVVEHETG